MNALPPLAAAGAACSFMAWAVRGRTSSVFGRSVWCGPPDREALALTFDDGPSESTPQILEILAEYAVPATCFEAGRNVGRLPWIAWRNAHPPISTTSGLVSGVKCCSQVNDSTVYEHNGC